MRAAVYHLYGPPEVLSLEEVPDPVPAAGQVVVRVRATGVNPKDAIVRGGVLKFLTGKRFPKRTGSDLAGEVSAVGPGVTGLARGEAVYGYLEDLEGGAAAELVAVPATAVARKPESLDFEHAAAVPCAYLTALQALRGHARLSAGQAVCVYGASGGVGAAAVQLAKHFGARVTAVCGPDNVAFCRGLGADEVVDHRAADVFAGGRRFDAVLQVYVLGGSVFGRAKAALKSPGVFVTLTPSPVAKLRSWLSRVLPGPRFESVLVRADRDDLEELARLAAAGVVRPHVSRVFELADIRAAHAAIETGHTRGKIVVRVGTEGP